MTETPVAVTLAVMVKVALAPLFKVPTVHRPVVLLKLPWLGVADTNETPGSRTSLTVTLVAASGPEFLTVIVKVTFWPTVTEVGSADLVSDRSACGGVMVTHAS